MKKPLIALLGVSLLGNAVLLVAFQQRSAEEARETGAASASAQAQPEAVVAAAPSPDSWKRLANDDLGTLVANLRAAGFPDSVARGMVGAILRERYAARRRALLGNDEVPAFWKARSGPIDLSKRAELRALAMEQRDEMKQLFGSDDLSAESHYYLRRMYGDLPAEKLDSVQRIQSDYAEMQMEVRNDAGGVLLPEDRENLALIEQAKRKDLEALLSPAELESFDLYSSRTAQTLRSRLGSFDPTEQEFRKIFALQQAFDEKYSYGQLNLSDPTVMAARAEAQKALNEELKTSLGEARYAEYSRNQNNDYRIASRIAERLQLPAQNAVGVYNLAQDMQTRMRGLRAGVENPNTDLASMVREANERLTVLLGERGAETYKQSAGSWLRSLERVGTRPARAVPVSPGN